MKYFYTYDSPVGILSIVEENKLITHIIFGNIDTKIIDAQKMNTEQIQETILQLKEYFKGEREAFNISLNPSGTEFQKKVWQVLTSIPYGETRSYEEIAEKVCNKKAARAVGMANNKNPIPIIIPCHRVIGKNKKLVGYGGGLKIKQKLLEIEKKR